MFGGGPQPSEDIIDDRAEHISQEAALGAWMHAYQDGARKNEYRFFEDDPDIQPIYHDGYERGKSDQQVMERFNEQGNANEALTFEKRWSPEDALPDVLYKPVEFLAFYSFQVRALKDVVITAGIAILIIDRLVNGDNR